MTRSWQAGVGALLLATACGGEPEYVEIPSMRVDGVPVVVQDTTLADVFPASGKAEPYRAAVLGSKLMGSVTSVGVQEGDPVSAGQVLVRLDARELAAKQEQVQAGLAAAEAAYEQASLQARRMRALYADSAAPRAQLDAAETGLAQAEAAVRSARASGAELVAVADYATIQAPFAGTVTQRHVDPGALAAPGMPLVTIEDQTRLRIVVTMPPDLAAGLSRGQELHAEVGGIGVPARVEGIVPASTGHVVTVNALIENGDGRFPSGASARLDIPRGLRPGLVVPAEAVVREGDLTGVYLMRRGVTDLRWIRIGRLRDGAVEVLSGLAPGDTVLVRTMPEDL